MVRVGGEVTGRPGEGGLEAGGEGGRLVSQLVAGMRGQVVRVKGRVVVWRERRGGWLVGSQGCQAGGVPVMEGCEGCLVAVVEAAVEVDRVRRLVGVVVGLVGWVVGCRGGRMVGGG